MAKRKDQGLDDIIVDVIDGSEAVSATSFIENNQKNIISVLAILGLLILGYFAYKILYQVPRGVEAAEQMYKAEQQFAKDSFALALTNPGGGYPGFIEIIESYGGTPAGNTANYYAGVSYLNLGDFQKAIDYLEDFSPEELTFTIMKYGVQGDAYAELNDMDTAISFYNKAANAGEHNLLTPYYLKKVGMWYEKNGDKGKALAAYENIKKNYQSSNEGKDIVKYIARVK